MKKYNTSIVIGKPDDGGNILITHASNDPDTAPPLLGDPLGPYINELLNDGFKIVDIEFVRMSGSTQYTLVKRSYKPCPCPCPCES
ncbi:hypothetical protein PV797_13035 [Clostridiaceae bacterium M8S5]|nr:hypothetical protein PV797_13035 [Clostridiaceae bacterium M8S5]